MLRGALTLPRPAHGIVVRPCPGDSGGSAQALLLLGNQASQFRLLEGGSGGESFSVGPAVTLFNGAVPGKVYEMHQHAHCPVYDPVTDSVYFAEGYAVMRLDSNNTVSLVAGSKSEWGTDDGEGESSRFWDIRAMAADGAGAIYIAEPRSIRKLHLAGRDNSNGSDSVGSVRSSDCASASAGKAAANSCFVNTLPGSAPKDKTWVAIAYDPAASELLAATDRAICHVPLLPPVAAISGGDTKKPAAASIVPQLIAGDWTDWNSADGAGTAARFHTLYCMLPAADRRTYIVDNDGLRVMDAQRSIRTLLPKALPGYPHGAPYMAVLPSGCLAIGGSDNDFKLHLIGFGFAPSMPITTPVVTRLGKHLQLAPAADHDSSGSDAESSRRSTNSGDCASAGNKVTTAIVTVHVGPKSFVAHRSLLCARSEYFRQLLGGGFAESGAAEASLPDADPDAFALLLEFMYTGVLDVPNTLLRPTAELAGRLLMPGVTGRLKQQIMSNCRLSTVVQDLLWAERHAMTELLPDLMAYFVCNRREIAAAAPHLVDELAAACPALAAQLILALSSA